MTDYYRDKLEEGKQFQDWVQKQLLPHGLIVMLNTSETYQKNVGESLSGIEIKKDNKFRETGNLFIEVAEKSDPCFPNFVPSGIYRNDNSWLYCIGDYKEVYILPKKILQVLYEDRINRKPGTEWRGIETRTIQTSKGMLLPIRYAEENNIVLRHIVFDAEVITT